MIPDTFVGLNGVYSQAPLLVAVMVREQRYTDLHGAMVFTRCMISFPILLNPVIAGRAMANRSRTEFA